MQIDPPIHNRNRNRDRNREVIYLRVLYRIRACSMCIAKPRIALGNSNSCGASALHELPFYLRSHLRPTNTPSHIGEDDTCGVRVTLALERTALHRTNFIILLWIEIKSKIWKLTPLRQISRIFPRLCGRMEKISLENTAKQGQIRGIYYC